MVSATPFPVALFAIAPCETHFRMHVPNPNGPSEVQTFAGSQEMATMMARCPRCFWFDPEVAFEIACREKEDVTKRLEEYVAHARAEMERRSGA